METRISSQINIKMMEDRKDQTSKDNSSNALYSVVNPSFELQHTKGLERPTVEQNMEKKIIGANSKQKFRSLNCAVCGDNAHGLYLGVLSCTACEIFFKQSIRKKAVYCCIGAQKCPVTKYNRHRCQFCRLQKCFFVGMKSKTSLQRDIPKKINDSLMQKTSPQISMLKDPANPSVLLPIFPTKMDVPSIPKVSYYPMTNLHGKILQQEQKYLVVGRLLTMQTNSNTDLRALSNIVATHATTANTVEPPYSNYIVSVAKAANGSPSVSCSQEFKTIIGGSSEEQSRISCIRSEEQCQTTYITSKPPQTTFISSEQFQTTCIRSEQSQTTCISSEQSQTTCINSEQPEITCISSEQSQTTCIDNEEQTWNPCIGREEKSLTPCKSKVQLQTVCQSTCHEEESLTSFKSIEEQSPTPCKSTEEQGQNLCISDEEESSIHFINIEEQSPATCLSDEKQFQASCISNEEQPLTFSLTNKEQLQITCKSSEEHSQTLCISNKEESWIPLTKPKKQCQTLCEDEEQYPKKRKREDLSSFSPSTYASNEEKTTKNYSDRNWRVKDLEAIKIFYEKKPVSFKTFVRTVKSVYSPGTYFTETVSKFCQLEKEHINFSLDFEDFPSPGSDACDIDAVKKKMLAELEQNREKIAATLSDPHKKLTVFKGILWNLAADLFLREIIELVTKMARRLISSIGRQKMAPKKAKKRRSERLRVLTKKLNIGRNEEHGMISTEASEISTKEQRTGVSGRWTKRTREQKTGANEARGKRTEEQRTGVNERRGKRTHEQKTGASERRGKRTHEGKTGATERRGKRTHEHKAGVNERKGNRTQEGKTGANEARGKRTEEYSVEIDKDDFCYIDLYKIFGEVYFLKFGEAIKRSVTILKNTTSCRPDLSYFLFNSQTYLFSIIQAETVQEEEGSNIALEDQVGSDVLGRVAVNLLAEAPFSVFKPYSLGIICVKTKIIFVFLTMPEEHLEGIAHMEETSLKTKGRIRYTRSFDILIADDRAEIAEFMFWLGCIQNI